MKTSIFILFALAASMSFAFSYPYDENSKLKFGKIDAAELEMAVYEKDTGAAAVVLADIGRTYFNYSTAKGDFEIVFEKHCRVKILKNNGYDYANIEIPIYRSGSVKEMVSGLKAATYNLENGKMTTAKLERKNTFEESQSENVAIVKFTMPNIAVGSVFEFTYRIISDLWRIRGWEFQNDIPVSWSEYEISVPEYYQFLKIGQGYEGFYLNNSKKESKSITFLVNGKSEALLYTNYITYWAAKDMPGLADEKFIASPEDFTTKVEFQIATIQLPYSRVYNILADWPEVEKKLLEDEDFGLQINRSGFMKTELQTETQGCADDLCKAVKVYEFIRRNMAWNNRSSYYCETNVKKAFTDRVGNSAEINLALIAALREVDLQADPVILSERNNGRIHPVHPILSKYNYVIAAVKIEGKDFLFDATDKFVSPGLLPARCLNYQGRLISKTNSRWIGLQNMGQSAAMIQADLHLTEDGTLAGKLQMSLSGYQAVNGRKSIFLSEEDYIKKLKDNKKTWDIRQFSFENKEKLGEKLISNFEIEIAEAAQIAGDVIFINPMLTEGMTENPFNQEKRKLPIDLNYPVNSLNHFTISIPEGYEVDEFPKNTMIALPNNGGTFAYSISIIGDKIQVLSNYNIKKTFFQPEEFLYLKEFHSLVVAKHAEPIVLKKLKKS